MSLALIAALIGLLLSLVARRRRRRARLELDDLVLALAIHVGLVGVTATALAWCGWFGPHGLSLACAGLALACWPWTLERERAPAAERPTSLGHTLILLVIVAGGIGLRQPTIPAALAGRDQGTYVLRAELSARTGALGWTDPVLAAAGDELDGYATPAGALDLLGLYPTSNDPWRRDRYDGAYRPGAYLGDRERGEVIPQFFHLHPMLLAVSEAALGPGRLYFTLTWIGGLWLLALACCARRLWPRGPWAALALALIAASPLAIWTARTPLSENPMALFEWAAVLAALRMRDGVERGGAWWVAGCLGLCAFVRGNALIVLPVVLALVWLRPRARDSSRWAAHLVLGALLASVILHAASSYPYVHDELLRQLPNVGLGPASLVTLAVFAALAWIVVDFELRELEAARLLASLPRWLALACFAAFGLWWSLRGAAPEGRPYSRLDAAPILLGAPLLVLAGAGVILVARRWRPRPDQIYLVALAAIVPVTAMLYAPRQLPTLTFFYYGRYLVPELLPAAALAATAAIAFGVQQLAGPSGSPKRARTRIAWVVGAVAALGLLGSVAGPLVRYPQLRLREHAAAGEARAWLAARLPADAVVIAGGEGWHNGHTHNQVGGALAMAHGVTVLPYRTREDAWISAWELLVAGPARRGQAPPPVFLLVNEAAHQHTREDGTRVALLDEQLWAPFVVERASLLELFVHALTPIPDQLPTRVARHELRMGLLRLAVDPAALARIERVSFERGAAGFGREIAAQSIRGGLHDDGRTCVSPDRPLKLVIPRSAWPAHVVVVAADVNPRSSARVPSWSLTIDGVPVALEPPPGLPGHARATLGPAPIPLALPSETASDTLTVEILGAKLPEAQRAPTDCPHGRVAALYLLPRERSSVFELDPSQIELTTIAPEHSLGHEIVPTAWVAGRSLSRYRPGTTPTPALTGLAMRLPAGMSLSFAPIDLPLGELGRPRPLDLLVTLAGTSTDARATLHVYANERRIGTIEPPAMRTGSWIAPPIVWRPGPDRDRAQLRVELVSPGGGAVDVRDLALFARHEGLTRAD
ncbi:hypothetical protein DB30_06594 [Enhygromyxa salina]|uniref:Glycosyltransferase RgtA/B/C/D-like domain-containing protein n=1 Tax=Enhygromyxa salina TaxID=215803 RepID=A0A0C2A6H4_9BACT|nr:hypothetical protein [Enhygromyxa salina]KIG18983.1 hypothetical protein DB30_06594 [Enhygromyxa salina]